MPNENSARVVFLIDTNDPSIDASKIKQIALQILLYFYDYVDKKVTWGYRFFSSESAAVDAAKHPLYPFMPEHISAFETKCARKLRQESRSSVPRSPVGKRQTTSYSVLKETMMQILAEFQWASTDSYLNTTRQKTKPTCFQSNKQGHGVETKNHVYMLTNCPDTYEAMLRYVGYSDIEDADTTEDQKIEHMAQAIHFMAQDMQKSLLGNYIQRQISFNWINTLGNPNEPEKSFQKPISHGLSKFLGLFGGHMIPYYLGLVNHAKYGCSFSTLFSSYFSSEIDTVMKNTESTVANPAHSMESYITHIKDKTKDDTPFWEGEFYLGHDAYFLSERQGARKEYQVRLKPFFRTTRELPLEERNFPTSVNDLFSRINVFRTVALINNANVRAHWFENDGQESKRLEFVMTSKDPDTATFIDLIDSLIASHQVILVDLQARRASRSNGPHVHTQALLQPLTSGFMNVILLTSPVEADELQSLESGARFPKIHPPETTQLDLPSLLEVAPFSIRAINHYKRVAANGSPIILNESPEVLEILTAYREKKKAEEEAKSKQKVQSKPATGKIKTVDTPITRLPIDEDEFVKTVKRLYLEALYTNKWTHLGMMENLIACVGSARHYCVTSDIIVLLGMWSRSWIDMDNHHREIEDQLNGVKECVDLEESRYIKLWEEEQLSNANSSRKEVFMKLLKMRETKLQISLYLMILSLKKEMRSTDGRKRHKRHTEEEDGITNWKPMDRYSTLPEELVDIFLDRIQIWEVASSIRDELVEINAEREGSKTQSLIDPADISLRTFVKNVGKCFSDTLPDVVRSYREKIDDDDPEVHSSQTSEKPSRSISNPKKIRKVSSTSKSSRTRSSNPVTSSSSLAATTINRAVRAPELPFMKREVDLVPAPRKEVARRAGEASRYIDTKIERSKVNGKPTIKRAGSFTTSARSSKSTAPEDLTQYNPKVQLRRPLSPTTPITRISRQFGFELNIADD